MNDALRALRRRLRPERVPLTVDTLAGAAAELEGRRGCVTRYQTWTKRGFVWEADACCPGCGQAVVYLPATTHPLLGPEAALECPAEFHFRVCCGWRGRLRGGVWIGA